MKKKITAVAITFCIFISFFAVQTNAETRAKTVILGGMPFGLKLFTNGVIVIKIDDDNTPAANSEIEQNDIIVSAQNQKIESNEQLRQIIQDSGGNEITLTIIRDNEEIKKQITPSCDDEMNYFAGMWIRDSTAGIGTITYFDTDNNSFGALGHGICDKDTGMLMPLKDGNILSATISGYTKGTKGTPGGLNGYFNSQCLGEITINNGYGVYGVCTCNVNGREIAVAKDSEIKQGNAKILTTIDSTGVKEYDVEIQSLNISRNSGQNMVLKVTDSALLDKTGGIIQGMSGSPIVQDGKLIGAVTHVFVNSPEKGYGITISNMLTDYKKFG